MAVGWVRQQLILYSALLRLIQARFAQVTGTFGWKTLMAAYYTHFHEGQRYWRRWANVRRHSSKSCPAPPISLTTGRNALPKCSPQMTCTLRTKSGDSLHHRAQTHHSQSFPTYTTIAGQSVCGYDAQTLCHPSLRYLMRYKSNCLQFTRLTWHQYLDCSYLN